MNLFSSLIITSNAARIYFTTVSVKDLTLSQVFCSDVLDSRHQLCVKLDFHFVGSSSVLCFLGKIKWPKSPLSSLMGLFLRLYTPVNNYPITVLNRNQNWATQQHCSLQKSVFLPLIVSLLPGCVQFISFSVSCCVHLLRLFLLQSSPSIPYLLIFCLTESPYIILLHVPILKAFLFPLFSCPMYLLHVF